MKKIVQIYSFVLHGVLVPKDRLNKNFLSIFLLNQSSNVFRSRRIVFKKGLLNQEYNNILLVGILNMEIPQGFLPPGDKTAINWATLSFLILSSTASWTLSSTSLRILSFLCSCPPHSPYEYFPAWFLQDPPSLASCGTLQPVQHPTAARNNFGFSFWRSGWRSFGNVDRWSSQDSS